MAKSKERLIVFFDGTWNNPIDRTNVFRLCYSLKDFDGETRQRFFYDSGVGTEKGNKFRGGILGYKLSENLFQGYEWLARRYSEGDEIWIFGFSRGAFTARSLAGLIRKCGLMHVVTPDLREEALKLYHNKSLHPDDPTCSEFRQQFSHTVDIHFLGVWDTVGALGIPGTRFSERGRFSWHDTKISKIVKRAYQAMALDEHRAAYDSSLWTTDDGNRKTGQIEVEQRWFVGAHANVGGGYGIDPLADLTLEWMQSKAQAAGLKLEKIDSPENYLEVDPRDSFKEFLKGAYSVFRKLFRAGDGRYHRKFGKDYENNQAVNVTVDSSVWMRWNAKEAYRPETLSNEGLTPPDSS